VDRTAAAVLAAKAAGFASRTLGRGGGTALPGLVAERIDPRVVQRLARQLGRGRAIVTGTNGKTTTSRMLAGILAAAGVPVIHNRSGSNLMRGLAATLTAAGGLDGRIPNAHDTAGVFEVDEATLPQAVLALAPSVIAVTNLFRDQLDRYGEVDSILTLWRRAVMALPPEATLVLNADDPSVAALRHDARGPVLTFGVEEAGRLTAAEEHPADSRWCGICGTEFSYRARFFWHVGHWSCSGCADQRPHPEVSATRIDAGPDQTVVAMMLPSGPLRAELPLAGLYNVYNALAATATALALGAPPEAILRGLAGFSAAFGRQESLTVRGRDVRVLLCKNPAGVNQVLRTILAGEGPLHVLLILNDDIADGRDVSWIWDVDFELLEGQTATLIASGTRAADMALRLKYAGLEHRLQLEEDLHTAIARAISQTPPGARLYVLPTYTAMLAAREHLAALAGQARFWKQ
jgi:UDP-N-acetylmuramyl tripeptide synthase